MAIPKRELKITVEVTTGAAGVQYETPSYTGDLFATDVTVDLTKNGEPYSPEGVTAEMYLYWPDTPIMTKSVELAIAGSQLSGTFPESFTAKAGRPMLVIQLTDDASGDLIVAAAVRILIMATRGSKVISTVAPSPSEMVYVGRSPYVDETTGNWMQWDAEEHAYIDSGVYAMGDAKEEMEAAAASAAAAAASQTAAGRSEANASNSATAAEQSNVTAGERATAAANSAAASETSRQAADQSKQDAAGSAAAASASETAAAESEAGAEEILERLENYGNWVECFTVDENGIPNWIYYTD